MIIYQLNQPFPEERYISTEDRAVVRLTPDSFDIVITLTNSTSKERRTLACGEITVHLFVYEEIPHIILDYGIYCCDLSINIKKLKQAPVEDWISNKNTVINIFLLEEVSGKILNMRLAHFPLMSELKSLLTLQTKIESNEIDNRIAEAEKIYSIIDMVQSSIFVGNIPSTISQFIDVNPEDHSLN